MLEQFRIIVGLCFFVATIACGDLPSGLPNRVAELSANAPDWARSEFSNMSESPFASFVEVNPRITSISKDDFFPFIDKYGQFVHL